MSEINPVYHLMDSGSEWASVPEDEFERQKLHYPNDCRVVYSSAAYEAQIKRANALALVINDLTKIVTHDTETKEQFIERVKSILSIDPDLRVSELQTENAVKAKRIAELGEESELSTYVLDKLSEILRSIAVTLKGEPAKNTRHSHHDLPELVSALKLENELNKVRIADQLEAIEATADFAKAFWRQADKNSQTRVAVAIFKDLEQKLRTYLPKIGDEK